MKLDSNLFAAKPASLEEGPRMNQQPEAIIASRVEIRGHYQRCVQVLKVILYLELILFVGWLGCVSMAKYYEEPRYNNPGMSSEDSFGTNDTSDEEERKELKEVLVQPLVQETTPRQETPLQESLRETLRESSTSSPETVSSDSPVRAYVFWMRETDPSSKSAEPSRSEFTTEPIVDAGENSIEFTTTATNSPSDETNSPDLDISLSKWLDELALMRTDSDFPYGSVKLEKLFNDDDEGVDSGLLIPEPKTDDDSEVVESLKSFEERWTKIMAGFDEDLNALEPDSSSSDEFKSVVRIPQFDGMNLPSRENFDAHPDHPFELPLLRQFLFDRSYLDESRDSDEPYSSPDLASLVNLHFDFADQLVNEENFWRNVRDTGAVDDSDSKSSSEETTTVATKTKRSPDNSSPESDESSDSSSGEDVVGKMMTKTLSPACPKIVGEDGRTIEDPKGMIAHIKKHWTKSLLETPVPNCGDENPSKVITIDECGKFVIECKPSETKNEKVEGLINVGKEVR